MPLLSDALWEKSIFYNFYILYDNSIDTSFKLISPESSIKIISQNFGNVIWPSINSNKLIFTIDSYGKPKSNQQFDEFNFIKEQQVEVLRGNGTIISSAALLNPLLMFKNPNFEFID